jgi:hypothetical protein
VNRWLSCSKCLASIGIGCKKAAQILGLTSSSVTRGWQNHGVKAARPTNSSMVFVGRGIAVRKRQREERIWGQYERAWMNEIKTHKAFPDWGYEWQKEQSRRIGKAKYEGMSDEEKREHNQRCNTNKLKRWNANPEAKKRDLARVAQWAKDNPELNNAYTRKSIKKRKIIDPGFKIQCNLRNRMRDVMGSVRRGGWAGATNFTGCNTKQLAKHLESGFTKRMSWANYGTYWHVDHILPCASFDHADEKQVAQCWHWTNLRPLEAKKNMDKRDAITEPQMSLLLCITH